MCNILSFILNINDSLICTLSPSFAKFSDILCCFSPVSREKRIPEEIKAGRSSFQGGDPQEENCLGRMSSL